MAQTTRRKLAEVARRLALTPFHGYMEKETSNLEPIVSLFPRWNLQEADRLWCAAFVYYCCMQAGFRFPIRPKECVSCNLAGCGAWEEFAKGDRRLAYHPREDGYLPEAGDIVLYDYVFCNAEHDHIGIVLEADEEKLLAAEGNTFNENRSGIVERRSDDHIRGYIRIPDGFCY